MPSTRRTGKQTRKHPKSHFDERVQPKEARSGCVSGSETPLTNAWRSPVNRVGS